MKPTDQDTLTNIARSYIDTKFFYKGRGRGGLDCAGLIMCIYNLEDIFNYNNNDNLSHLKKELEKSFKLSKELLPESVLLFDDGHLAFYTDSSTIIHTYRKIGKVLEEDYNKFWKIKLDTIYRR